MQYRDSSPLFQVSAKIYLVVATYVSYQSYIPVSTRLGRDEVNTVQDESQQLPGSLRHSSDNGELTLVSFMQYTLQRCVGHSIAVAII